MRKILQVLMLFTAVAVMAACTKKQEPIAAKESRVSATKAYEKYFGPAPTTDKGNCYAFVIYFPSAREPEKVVPFPFFTFDEASIRKVAVERLLGGMDIGSYQGELTAPPAGSRLLSISDEQGTVTVNFSKEFAGGDKTAETATVKALALTLCQFKGVTHVRIQVEGRDSVLSDQTDAADDSVVQQPSPPRLLSVTAMRDKGAKEVEEVDAFFDRPVEIKELKLRSREGQQYAGDLYHSVFDMAGVLKPKERSQFKEKMPIKVRWKVIDKLGRQAEGDNVWLLEVKEH